jgi:Flp pilus assembly protein TadD
VALALQERYDEAFKHLRTALEQEEPKTPQTGGYLALCGALGKPSRPEDKPRNVLWAIRLLSRFDIVGDAEWAKINNQVFAEARTIGIAIPPEDQQRLMKILVSINAADIVSAQAILHFATTQASSLELEHSCLYCRAVQQHGLNYPGDLPLFSLLLRNEAAARTFYGDRGWDFDEVAFAYLERCAAQSPGRFPAELGSDFPSKGARMLMDRSRRQLASGEKKDALAAAEVLGCLAPKSVPALDWLAQVCYRQGDLSRAVNVLKDVQRLRPKDYSCALRLAIIAQESGDGDTFRQAINDALAVSTGPARAHATLLGARLLLRLAKIDGNSVTFEKTTDNAKCLQDAARLLEECLRTEPGHIEACWQLAAVRVMLADREGLAEIAPQFERANADDPRFHYFGAICQLACGNWKAAADAARRAAGNSALGPDVFYLEGLALLHLPDRDGARTALEKAATSASRSADHARALLGNLGFESGHYDQAVQRWQAVGKPMQAKWKLDEPLRSTLYLTALQAFSEQRYEVAAERFREAAKQGLRERKIGPLISLSLVKAGEKLLFAGRNGKRSRSAAAERP